MTTCVKAVKEGVGDNYILSLDLTQTDISKCTYTMEDGSSTAWRELGNMSIDNAATIGAAVGVVWAIAFGIKAIIRAMRTGEVSDS